MTTQRVSNHASKLGSAVGDLFQTGVTEALRPDVESRGHSIAPARLVNGTGNTYQIDAVVFNPDGQPVVILDVKYIRYPKHNRDKASWLCTAHYNLRKTHSTLRKSIAALAGNWTPGSKSLMRSFGVEIVEETFEHFVTVLGDYGVDFDWPERDRDTPARSLELFNRLTELERVRIAEELAANISDPLQASVTQVLDTDMSTLPSRISNVEIILQTDQNEMVLLKRPTVTESIQALTGFISDNPDISDLVAGHHG